MSPARGGRPPPRDDPSAGTVDPGRALDGIPFPREILARDTLEAARALIGAWLVREADDAGARRVGRIVEVEAYIGGADQASHARMGRTPRNAAMYGPPGHAYVYLVYGMHHCLNVVTEPVGKPAAVLVRALEPLRGIEAMRVARARARSRIRRPATTATTAAAAPTARTSGHVADARLAAGPGLVAAAFDIDRSHDGADLCDPASPIHLERPVDAPVGLAIQATPRIGIAYAGEPWTADALAVHPGRQPIARAARRS